MKVLSLTAAYMVFFHVCVGCSTTAEPRWNSTMQPSQSFWNRFIDKQSNTLITNQKSRKKRRIQQTRSDNNNNNSSSNNNNNKNNTAQYGAGLVPEENEDEIDCSKFSDLDELPPFCQENPDGQAGGGDGTAEDDALPDSQVQPPPDDAASGTMIGTGETVLIDNTIQVPFSLGIYLYDEMTEQRSEDLVSLVVQVTSILLDRYTPFDVYAPSPEDDLILIEMDDGEAGGFGDGIDGDDSNGRFEDNGTQLLASMYFSSVTVWDSPFWNSWLQLSIAYAVVWPNEEPLVDPVDLQQVELAARQVFNMTVDALKFWEELVDQDFNGHYVMQDGETWNESGTSRSRNTFLLYSRILLKTSVLCFGHRNCSYYGRSQIGRRI